MGAPPERSKPDPGFVVNRGSAGATLPALACRGVQQAHADGLHRPPHRLSPLRRLLSRSPGHGPGFVRRRPPLDDGRPGRPDRDLRAGPFRPRRLGRRRLRRLCAPRRPGPLQDLRSSPRHVPAVPGRLSAMRAGPSAGRSPGGGRSGDRMARAPPRGSVARSRSGAAAAEEVVRALRSMPLRPDGRLARAAPSGYYRPSLPPRGHRRRAGRP